MYGDLVDPGNLLYELTNVEKNVVDVKKFALDFVSILIKPLISGQFNFLLLNIFHYYSLYIVITVLIFMHS